MVVSRAAGHCRAGSRPADHLSLRYASTQMTSPSWPTVSFQHVDGLLSHVRPEDIKNVADLTGIPPHTVRRILKELGAAIEPGDDDGDRAD